MSEGIILLLVISAGTGAYLKARQEGIWSWPLFVKTVLWLLAIGGVIGITGIWIGRFVGPEHVMITTIGTVAGIVGGVLILALWMRNKTGQGKK